MNEHINIAIIEPSDIIYEGLSNILLQLNSYFRLYRIEDIEELSTSYISQKLNISIINPTNIQNRVKDFQILKKKLPNVLWAGLIYSFFDTEIISLFDKMISINDSPDSIKQKLNQLIIRTNAEENSEERLTEREIEVLKQIVNGLSNKEIADKLNISVHTVISHRKNITHKTGIKSQSGLTIYSINNHIITLDS